MDQREPVGTSFHTRAGRNETIQEVITKMIDESMAAQRADVNQIKKKRGQSFVIDDTNVYVDAVKGMKAAGNQSCSLDEAV